MPGPTAQEREFSRLWQAHRDELLALCTNLMGGNMVEAEDALGRAALLALEKYSRYAGELQNPKAWLKRLVFNSSIDILRERQRAQQVIAPQALEDEPHQEELKTIENPEQACLQRELGRQLQRFIEELPARLQQPVVMRLVHAREYLEIARCLKITEENARKLVQLGRMQLRKALKNYLDPEML
ncbi:sigma-70 family RNA polymerase sigma factor [Stigmatella sp. ncwal1]|uniref:Sigma-70 family RNA polymerase sigma factor n=2 Tax=Stigmatella ashevillensis TaxID=2995309 RepID=A0ABT5D940_9BACT|nr:sigma-70 family RNA polymerase sigma factor [Stigmatella ashevillena]